MTRNRKGRSCTKSVLFCSEQANVSPARLLKQTVAGIFKRWAKRRMGLPRQQVRVLGVDEIALKKRHKQYVLVLSDLERCYVLAVLPTREQKV
jgi:hypothetical protein